MLEKWVGNITNQRDFFDRVAKHLGFHPTRESYKWNDVTYSDIAKHKVCNCVKYCLFRYYHIVNLYSFLHQGGRMIAKIHGGFRQAIEAAYPGVRLDQSTHIHNT